MLILCYKIKLLILFFSLKLLKTFINCKCIKNQDIKSSSFLILIFPVKVVHFHGEVIAFFPIALFQATNIELENINFFTDQGAKIR